ncbi:MAG: magnesium/cobalt transporter CorA [Acidobacteria bacterium]|nr:magnesium/cobalt transporter CorA [Acidobacteriota bacterium]
MKSRHNRHKRKRSTKVGLSPGTLVHVGEQRSESVRIQIIDYNPSEVREIEAKSPQDCFPLRDQATVTWINVEGLHELEVIEQIGRHLNLHPLTLEDIVNTEQRPKLEEFEDYIFIVLRMFQFEPQSTELKSEQLSLILGRGFVLSFQERPGDIFDPVRQRIRSGKGTIRNMKADYLAYALLDSIVDNYFAVLEGLGERLQDLEDELVSNPTLETLQLIHKMKREVIFLRKSVWPLREVVSSLLRGESNLVEKRILIFLRDVYDHTVQVIETVEVHRDMLTGVLDIYLSGASNRLSEVMKILTIIATIFIPLTFIAGIYGMNFAYMPELQSRWGYPLVWLVMVVVAAAMLVYFRRKKWL